VFVSFAPRHLAFDASGEECASDFFSALALLLSVQSALLPLPPVVGPLASELEWLEVSRQFDLLVRSLFECDEELEDEELGAEEVVSAGGAVLGV